MHPPVYSLRSELEDTLKLAGPIVLNQVGHMSMGLVDTLVAGRISTTALAGLGLAANFFWTFTSVCVGCLLALDTYFSQAVGAQDERGLARYLSQSFWACGIATVASGLGVIAGHLIYLALASASPQREAFAQYIHVILWCLPSLFVYFVLQRYWQARHRVMPFTTIVLAANALNLAACFGFGLGKWGLPELGVRGIALATVLSRYAMLLAAVVFTLWQFKPASIRPPRIDWRVQGRIFRLGLPAAGHTALEIGAFTIATFVVGALGAIPLAAHHTCLMMAAFTFMFPLGFSSAAAVRVGMFVGSSEPRRARLAGWLCIGCSIAVMSGFALGYLVFPRALLGFFTGDSAVIGIGVRILALVALFQIADGIQVSTTCALRGIGNTRTPMIANLIGHYPIGLVLGLALCFGFGFGVLGLWAGLAAGLISVAAMLLHAWRHDTKNVDQLRPMDSQAKADLPPPGLLEG
jgi:MATE family multidrug resistance protein